MFFIRLPITHESAHSSVTPWALQAFGPLGSPILGKGFIPNSPDQGFLAMDFGSAAFQSIAAAHGVTPQQVARSRGRAVGWGGLGWGSGG